MLRQVADGVLIHQSELLQNNAVVVHGRAGTLVIDPGITGDEMACLANDLRESGQPVVAGFSTHPDWDHVLWHADLGEAPRYGTARCAAFMRELLSTADWRERVAEGLPPEIAEDIPLGLFGLITGLPAETAQIPWDGPEVRIVEHPAHAQGHAALLIEESGVLVAGDMLSDILVPFPDLSAADPIEDYLVGLRLLEDVADDVAVVIPGHGSVGGADELRERIELDRAYVHALRDGHVPDDPRIGQSATFGKDWLPGVAEWQAQQLAQRRERDGTPELDTFVEEYFAQYRAEFGASREERLSMQSDAVEHRSWQLDDMVMFGSEEQQEAAWTILLALIERAPVDEWLAFVAAGPLEDLVRQRHDRFEARLLEEARRNGRFRLALRGVWGWEELPQPFGNRLMSLAGFPVAGDASPQPKRGPSKRKPRTGTGSRSD